MKPKDFTVIPVDQWQRSVLFKYLTYIFAIADIILLILCLYVLFTKHVIYINPYKEFGIASRSEITDDIVAMFAEKFVLTIRNVNETNIDEIFEPYDDPNKLPNTFFYRYTSPTFREKFYPTMIEWRRLIKKDGRADRFYNTEESIVVKDKNLYKVIVKGIEEFYVGSEFLKSFRTDYIVTVRPTSRTDANPIGLEVVDFGLAKPKEKIFSGQNALKYEWE